MSPEVVTQHHARERHKRDAERKRDKREADHAKKMEAEMMQTQTTTTALSKPTPTLAEMRAADLARTKAQRKVLFAAIPKTNSEEVTAGELAETVRRDPAWQGYRDDDKTLRRAVNHRLDQMEAKGWIASRYEPAPRGLRRRFVRRRKAVQ